MNTQPVLFLAHGDPMNALRDNEFTRSLRALGEGLAKPDAVVVFSAHWLTRGTAVGSSASPSTIHDFGGFPEALYRERYGAPGAPDLAAEVAARLAGAMLDPERGLDHGVWSVLKFLLPDADVPVVPVSLDATASARDLMEQGRVLRDLRGRNVLLVGSGNVVHSIPMYFGGRDDAPFPWAVEFDARVRDAVLTGSVASMERGDQVFHMAHPTSDHLLPLYPCVGATFDGEVATFPHEEVVRSMSMRCIRWSS